MSVVLAEGMPVWISQRYADRAPEEIKRDAQGMVGASGKISNVRVYAGGNVEVDVVMDSEHDFLEGRYAFGRYMECLQPDDLQLKEPSEEEKRAAKMVRAHHIAEAIYGLTFEGLTSPQSGDDVAVAHNADDTIEFAVSCWDGVEHDPAKRFRLTIEEVA